MKIPTRAVSAAVLALSVLGSSPAHAAPAPAQVSLPLDQAIAALPVADEVRDGYDRRKFRHWTDEDKDGCHARSEVLKRDAVVTPEQSGRCQLTGGLWESWYDGVTFEGSRGIDIDHMVPLAEAWDSGASQWDAKKRERYANDLGDRRSLQAVSARSNRSKADKDPQDWMPPAADAACRYIAEWVAVKHRWRLTVDESEQAALAAHSCPGETVTVEIAE